MKFFQSILSLLLLSTPLFSDANGPFLPEDPTNSNIHGLVDVALKSDYMTPRGLLVSRNGLTTQVLTALALDVYKNPSQLISKVSVVGYIWNDLSSKQHSHTAHVWNEMDWGLGASFQIADDWNFTAQYVEFLSPPGHFTPEKNLEMTLAYNDSKWNLPVVFNPYVKWFWAMSGDSTVVVGKHGRTFDVEIGAIPTIDFRKDNFPLILSAPTWITVGPAEFWNGGEGGLKHRRSNFGVFTTGLHAEVPIEYIPKCLGTWYAYAGCQYYHLINDSLLKAQVTTLGVSSWHKGHRNTYVACCGIGFRF
jgi:hypothetical protein